VTEWIKAGCDRQSGRKSGGDHRPIWPQGTKARVMNQSGNAPRIWIGKQWLVRSECRIRTSPPFNGAVSSVGERAHLATWAAIDGSTVRGARADHASCDDRDAGRRIDGHCLAAGCCVTLESPGCPGWATWRSLGRGEESGRKKNAAISAECRRRST